MIAELRHRDPLLFWTGAAMLLIFVIVTLISISDNRVILGLNPWIKPMKFLMSLTIFLWTVGWFMPETEARPKSRVVVRWTIASAMAIEIALVIMQSARGTTSHFNVATAFDGLVFSIMGNVIVINTAVMGLLLWIIRRDTPPQRAGYLWGIRAGVALFVIASLQGFVMVANMGHAVPGPDGGPGLPFVNWSTDQGDLRVAHFFGLHALQVLPLFGFLLDRAKVSAARNLVVTAGILWLAVLGGLLALALQGRPLLTLTVN